MEPKSIRETRTCTLDEASARRILPGREIEQDQVFEDRLDSLKAARRVTGIPPGMSRNGAMKRMTENLTKSFGSRLIGKWSGKRYLNFMAVSLREGQVHYSVEQFKYQHNELVCTVDGICIAHLSQHATARIFQRLGTTDIEEVWRELKPTATHVFRMSLARRGLAQFSDALVQEGEVARVPTLRGHLVFKSGSMNAVTFNTDSGCGDKRLARIQTARSKKSFLIETDQTIEKELANV